MRSLGVLSLALTLSILLASEARGQSGSIAVQGQVSEAVFVSIAPGAQLSGDEQQVTYTNLNSHTVLLSITASGSDVRWVSIPVQLRSNVGYTLSASANLSGATLRGLCVTGARATGTFVATGAVENLNMAACEDATAGARPRNVNQAALSFSSPQTLLTGPQISLAGTFDTPSNALEVMLMLEVEPQDGQERGTIELTLSASPSH